MIPAGRSMGGKTAGGKTGGGFPSLSAAVLLGLGRSGGDPATRPLTILLAGAASNDAAMIRSALAAAGHLCVLAPNWTEAEAVLTRQVVDLLLLDLACPGARRFEAVKRLRAWPPPLSRLGVVALAGRQEQGLEAACQEAGCDALLSRPALPETLEATLRRVVAGRTPPDALDPLRRATLLAELGASGRRARDTAALDAASASLLTLRSVPGLPDVRAAAAAVAEAFEGVGAIAAAAAARALEATPDRRPVLLAPLVRAAVAAKMALRRA